MPEPTGPAPTNPDAQLRRTVNAQMMNLAGTEPLRGAFIRSGHDKMMSTFGEHVPPETAIAAADPENVCGVWPVRASLATEHNLGVYEDSGAACGCDDDACPRVYADGHVSVDLRTVTNRPRERFAEAARLEAVAAKALLRVDRLAQQRG